MNKKENILCFIIDKNEIFLEEVLVEYMGVPIFYVCHDNKSKYLVICTDIDELNYLIVKISIKELYDLLNGDITMRDAFVKKEQCWMVHSAEDIVDDRVDVCDIANINKDLLPKENAFFEVLSNDMKIYVNKVKKSLLMEEKYNMISEQEFTYQIKSYKYNSDKFKTLRYDTSYMADIRKNHQVNENSRQDYSDSTWSMDECYTSAA